MAEVTVIEPIDADGRSLAKGNLMRGWHDVLQEERLIDTICERLTPEVASLLRDPPASTAWVDVAFFECVAEAVRLEVGEKRLMSYFVRAMRVGWVALLSRFLGGMIKIFGPSPHTVFARIENAAKANTVGFDLSWKKLGETSGELSAHYPFRPRIYEGGAWGTWAVCKLMDENIGVPLRLEPPRLSKRGVGTVVVIAVAWG
jgi:hypothetical protein